MLFVDDKEKGGGWRGKKGVGGGGGGNHSIRGLKLKSLYSWTEAEILIYLYFLRKAMPMY